MGVTIFWPLRRRVAPVVVDRLAGESGRRFHASNGVGATAPKAIRADTKCFVRCRAPRCSDADHGDVHLVARNQAAIVRSAVGRARRKSDFDQQLARLQHVLAGARAELFHRHFAISVRSRDHAHAVQGDHAGRRVGCGARVAEIAAHTRAALNLDSADNVALSASAVYSWTIR